MRSGASGQLFRQKPCGSAVSPTLLLNEPLAEEISLRERHSTHTQRDGGAAPRLGTYAGELARRRQRSIPRAYRREDPLSGSRPRRMGRIADQENTRCPSDKGTGIGITASGSTV